MYLYHLYYGQESRCRFTVVIRITREHLLGSIWLVMGLNSDLDLDWKMNFNLDLDLDLDLGSLVIALDIWYSVPGCWWNCVNLYPDLLHRCCHIFSRWLLDCLLMQNKPTMVQYIID